MYEEEKRELLDELYDKLRKYKDKNDKKSIELKAKIKLKIKETKEVVTTEEFEMMMSERSDIDYTKC